MNKSKIEWCDYTWNPVTGCLHGCEYCYARRIAERFGMKFAPLIGEFDGKIIELKNDIMMELNKPVKNGERIQPYPACFAPTFHRYRLDEPKHLKKSSKIFVVSMGDLFGNWVPDEWINEVLKTVKECPQHTFMFLTKNPWKYEQFDFPENAWCGTTVTSSNDSLRAYQLSRAVGATIRFLSIEPLLGEIRWNTGALPSVLDWVIIGAETGNRKDKVISKREWIENIVNQCKVSDVPVFMKNSLQNIWGAELIQEFPKEADL